MYAAYANHINNGVLCLQVSDSGNRTMDIDAGFEKWCEITRQLKDNNSTMYMVGNGASSMMASHMAADASKNGKIRVRAFNDAALMTAVGNDLAYAEVFAMPLMRFAGPGDVLVTISSSGNSPNIIRAIEQAREMGLTVVTLSGMKPDNKSRGMGDLNFFIPAPTYGVVECAHQILLHYWLDLYISTSVGSATACFCLPHD